MEITVPIIQVREIIILLLIEEEQVHQLHGLLILLLDKVFVVPVLAHVILVLPILEVIVQQEIPEQVLVAAAVVATHAEVQLLHHEAIHLIDHHPALPIQVAIQEVVEVATHQVAVVVILAVLVAVAVLHVVVAVVALHVVLAVAIEDNL